MNIRSFLEKPSKTQKNRWKSRLYGRFGTSDGFAKTQKKLKMSDSERYVVKELLLQVVGYVELRLSFRCLALTEIAHGEVGQVGHCADNGSPFLHGIRKNLPKYLVVSNIFCTFVP